MDGDRVDPSAESAGLPDILEERMRAVGATDEEMVRFRVEHAELDYYDRFLRNQQARGYDDASVFALLELSRARWRAEGDKPVSADEPTAEEATSPPTELELRQKVPHGTREQVLLWVNDDPVRAQAALYVEQHTEGEEPRKTLVADLRKITTNE